MINRAVLVTAFLSMTALVLTACRGRQASDADADQAADGGEAEIPDGAMGDLQNDVEAPATDGPVFEAGADDTASCDWGVFNEGTLHVQALGSDGSGPECAVEPCGFVFTVSDRMDGFETTDTSFFSLLGSGVFRTWTISRLEFSITRGWDVTWSVGQQVDVLSLLRAIDCPVVNPPEVEFPVQTHLTLRDGSGKLLLLDATDVPLVPGGASLLDPAFAPEVTVSWTDLGCPAYQGPGVGTVGGGRRTIGVLIRDSATGASAMATWGRKATIWIRGESYVLAVNQGWMFADGTGCGRAKFALYREGYLTYRP